MSGSPVGAQLTIRQSLKLWIFFEYIHFKSEINTKTRNTLFSGYGFDFLQNCGGGRKTDRNPRIEVDLLGSSGLIGRW